MSQFCQIPRSQGLLQPHIYNSNIYPTLDFKIDKGRSLSNLCNNLFFRNIKKLNKVIFKKHLFKLIRKIILDAKFNNIGNLPSR